MIRQISDYLTEMSAMHNRKNDDLKNQIVNLAAQIEQNEFDDMERIFNQAGMQRNKRNKDMYAFTVKLAEIIYRSDKPYGAILYLLAVLKEYAEKNASRNPAAATMLAKLDNILSDNVMKDLVEKDPKFVKLLDKVKEKDEITGKHAANVDSLEYQIKELIEKYPDIDYWKDREL